MHHLLTNLKLIVLFLTLPLLSQKISAQEFAGKTSFGQKGFIENKGQIIDQDNKANNEVLYLLNMPGMNVQLKKNSFSYDTYVLKAVLKEEITQGDDSLDYLADFHRIDIEFMGANPNPVVVASEASADYLNFYTPGTPTGGVHGVKHYRKVLYKELYPSIDLEFVFSPEGNKAFEYNFILHPGADIKQVQWKYVGSENTKLENGKIEIETIHGTLRESIPFSYIQETGEAVTLTYRNTGTNSFGLNGPASDIPPGTIVVDPVPELLWAGYLGFYYAYNLSSDYSGNILFNGLGRPHYLATRGIQIVHSSLYSSSGFVKINALDQVIWSTFSLSTLQQVVGAKDPSCAIYAAGMTSDTFDIATPGTHQSGISGKEDVFLMKFDSSGKKIWGTFFGGTDSENVSSLTVDKNQKVYIAGSTKSNYGISTPGTHQIYRKGGIEGFLAAFDSSGLLQMSTYFGGTFDESFSSIATNDSGYIYGVGQTFSTHNIATPGAYRTNLEAQEGFVVKFNSLGQRVWSTYAGGNKVDNADGIICSDSGHIFITGLSSSDSIFGIPKSPYNFSYITRMDAGGGVIWTRLVETPTYERTKITLDEGGDLYVIGQVATDSFASSNAPFTSLNGISDGYIIKYTSSGQSVFATYFGGNKKDEPKGILVKGAYLYLFGHSESETGLEFNSPFEKTPLSDLRDIFLAKFLNTSSIQNNASLKQTASDYSCGPGKTAGIVRLNNSGQNPIDSVRINWELDGVPQPTIFYTGTLQMGADITIFLDSIQLQTGNKRNVKVWTSNPNGLPDSYSNDDTVRFDLMPGLSGTYTINKLSGDYTSFNASSDDLHKFGVCGPVSFTISNDVYEESLLLKSIRGASAINSISYSGVDRDSTIIEHDLNGFSNFATVFLEGANYINFSNLTVKSLDSASATGIWLRNNADSNSFRNLRIILPFEADPNYSASILLSGEAAYSVYSYGGAATGGAGGNYNLFDSIWFEGGSYQLKLQHINDSDYYAEGNTFSHLYLQADKIKAGRVNIRQQRNLKIQNSIFENVTFRILYSDKLNISNNSFDSTQIWMDKINFLKRDTLNISSVFNNFFNSHRSFFLNDVMDVKFYHNTFFNAAGWPIHSSRSDIDITNNIFHTNKYANSFFQSTVTGDYNIYHRTDSVLGNFTSVPSNEPNSLILDPLLVTDSTVEISRYVPGMPLGLENDIFGRPRCLAAPAIGAYEPINWIFAQPQISQNKSSFVNFPVEFSHNTDTLPGMEFQWLLDGNFLSDNITIVHSFSDTGSYSLQLVVKSCLKTDTVTYSVNVLPANPLISLLGQNHDSLAVFNTYLDSGAVAFDVWGQDISHLIQITSNLDTAVLGNYTITYLAIDSVGNKDSVIRTISVFDSLAPQITLIGNDTLFIAVFASINDLGVTATDNYDKAVVVIADSSAVDKSKTGFWPLVYTATDSSGNSTQISRWIKVQDTIKPAAQLLGPDTLIMEVHTSFNDPGVSITDNYCQSGMTWTRTSDPDTALLGDYLIEYTIADCEGNTGLPIYRTVQVRDQTAPVISLTGNSTVQHDRWTTYQDAGAQLSDNYYSPVILQDSLKTHTDLDENAEGTYTFCYDLTDPSGNKAATVCRTIEVKENPNNINSPNRLNAKLYPNPNKGEFVLELSQAAGDNAHITLTDMAGREIYYRKLISGSVVHTIHLERINSGSYILNLVSTDGKVSFRVEVLR